MLKRCPLADRYLTNSNALCEEMILWNTVKTADIDIAIL